jgi:hypothetical protein
MPPRAIALMNSIRIKWIASGNREISDETGQNDRLLLCPISNLTIISRIVFMAVMHFVQNTVQFVK